MATTSNAESLKKIILANQARNLAPLARKTDIKLQAMILLPKSKNHQSSQRIRHASAVKQRRSPALHSVDSHNKESSS